MILPAHHYSVDVMLEYIDQVLADRLINPLYYIVIKGAEKNASNSKQDKISRALLKEYK